MHRTQISLEENQYERLMVLARQEGISLSALIRRMLDSQLTAYPATPDPLDELMGIAEGTGEPVSEDHDHYLYGKPKR